MRRIIESALVAAALVAAPAAHANTALAVCGDSRETPERAARFCRDALDGRLAPREEALAALNLGLALLQMQSPSLAIDAFDRALGADPAEARALAGRAQAREATDAVPQAAVDWNRAVSLASSDPAILSGRGAFRLRSGNAEGALADFDAARRADPRNRAHEFNRGVALAELGRDDEAERAFSAVIAADASDVGAWLNRARVRASRDREAALSDFDAAVERAGDWPLPLFERGVLLDAMGRRDAADRDFRRAWELGHRSAFLEERMAQMRR